MLCYCVVRCLCDLLLCGAVFVNYATVWDGVCVLCCCVGQCLCVMLLCGAMFVCYVIV